MRIALVAVLSLLSGSGVALAQPTETVVAEMDERAREVFEVGRDAYQGERYRIAALAFERAYDLSGHAELLFNAGNAWERSADTLRAAVALRHYLRVAADAPETSGVRTRIAQLELGELTLDRGKDSDVVGRTSARNVEDGETGGLLGRRFTWIAAGAALAGAIAAGVLWAVASQRHDELLTTCGNGAGCPEDDISGVAALVTGANVAIGLTLAATASAVVLFFVEVPSEDSAAGPMGAFVSVRGRL